MSARSVLLWGRTLPLHLLDQPPWKRFGDPSHLAMMWCCLLSVSWRILTLSMRWLLWQLLNAMLFVKNLDSPEVYLLAVRSEPRFGKTFQQRLAHVSNKKFWRWKLQLISQIGLVARWFKNHALLPIPFYVIGSGAAQLMGTVRNGLRLATSRTLTCQSLERKWITFRSLTLKVLTMTKSTWRWKIKIAWKCLGRSVKKAHEYMTLRGNIKVKSTTLNILVICITNYISVIFLQSLVFAV